MRVERYVATVGFNVCMAIFVALSAYGILSYMSWDQVQSPTSSLAVLLYAVGVAGSIAGICFFGIQMDRRRLEDSRKK